MSSYIVVKRVKGESERVLKMFEDFRSAKCYMFDVAGRGTWRINMTNGSLLSLVKDDVSYSVEKTLCHNRIRVMV